jgi:hypothetical protein
MMKLHKNGFAVVELIIILLTIIIICTVGFFVGRHIYQKNNPTSKLGTFSYGGSKFPNLPSDFVLKNKTVTSDNSNSPTVSYTNSKPLKQIETEIINACKENNFVLAEGNEDNGQVSVGSYGTNNGVSYTDYDIQCDNDNNVWNNVWDFDITADKIPNIWDISAASFSVPSGNHGEVDMPSNP